MMFLCFIVAFMLCVKIANAYTDEAIADQIVNLPGIDPIKDQVKFNQFSGYLNINSNTGKRIHYWMVEASEVDPATAPVVFWTNGGPGCSGLIGFMTEMGPFRPNADGTLSYNPSNWNRIANMVYLEQPSGTGFSYSDTKDDYKTNDDQSTIDNYVTIQEFFKRFPEKASNPLYTTSESYGGHFMPLIAQKILQENKSPTLGYSTRLNYKGFAVGNPFTNRDSEYPGMFYTYWGKQILPKTTWDKYLKECVNSPKRDLNLTNCEMLEIRMGTEVGNLNPYAVDYPICVTDEQTGKKMRGKGSRHQMTWALNFMLPDHLKAVIMPTTNELYEPCEEDYNIKYLNRADVKAAIHVKSDIQWDECSSELRYNTLDRMVSMVPVYQDILAQDDANLSILVYSGDDDAVCGTIGTQEWIWSLGYSPVSKEETWKSWMYNGQVAGFATRFDTSATNNKLSFVTVHKAGHEVPAYVPQEGFDLFSKYLSGYWFQQLE